jgi:putative ABC transport system permease protein
MFKNYLKIIFRNITNNIVYVLINIIGLGLALAVCIVAYLNYKFDADFDTCHENREQIFRIEHTQVIEGEERSFASTPGLLGPTIVDDISGVEKMVRVAMDLMANVQLLKAGENESLSRLIYADPDFFDVFTFPLISGNKESFRDNNSVFITGQLAMVLFGDQDPVGEIVSVNDSPYTVGGVLENHPLNSSFQFEAIAPIRELYKDNNSKGGWGNIYGIASTFILVKDQRHGEAIEKSLQTYVPVVNNVNYHQVERFYLAPFKDMAHRGRSIRGHPFQPSVHPAAVLPPLIAAICILLIACLNFTNTTIAIAGKRLKEIGIRKVVGSLKRQLILQLMGENILLVFFALFFALFFAQYLVPSYSTMWDFMDLSFSISKDPELWIFIIVVLIAAAAISGAYPAFYISSFNPVNIFQDNLKLGGSNIFSKGILTLQYGISVLALFTGVTFIQNADYLDRFDIGYDGDYIVEVLGEDNDVYKNAIQSYPEIESISKSISGPFFNTRSIKYKETRLEAKMSFLEMESFSTLGLRLIEGRSFEPETKKSDEISSILVNRKFIEETGIIEPVGKTLIMSDSIPLTIIGVIENLLDEGVFTTAISPIFYRLADDSPFTGDLCIRVAPENRQEVFQYLKDEWSKLVPDLPFFGVEGDIYMEASQFINKKVLSISFFLVLISTLLSAAGLYSQVSLRIIHRTKEIGIRKIFGASIPRIIKILNYEFLVIFSIGSIVGIIAGYYSNVALMDSIWEYFTDLTAITFIIPVVIIFAVSVITVSGKVYYAATRNPVHSLRYE